jgi:hypothetical protein
MAQTPNPSNAVKDGIVAHVAQIQTFAAQVVANPKLIEQTAEANRAKVLKGSGAEAFASASAATNHLAESLYQIQEDLGLDAAIRAAQLLANLPTLPKGAK